MSRVTTRTTACSGRADTHRVTRKVTMSDADSNSQPPVREETSGLRRAMEERMNALSNAEERMQREQSALQEQAKVVFAEREARLARRERELSKREAAVAVSEGIAQSHVGHESDDDRARLAELEAELGRRAAELDAREQAVSQREAEPARSADVESDGDIEAVVAERVAGLERQAAALQDDLGSLQQQVEHERRLRSRVEQERDGLVEQLRER